MSKRMIVSCLVLVWVALTALSFLLPARVEGPRNIDTGFQRLDVFARLQFFAFGIAVLSVCLGFLWRRSARWVGLIGALPLGLSGLAVAGIAGYVMIVNPGAAPANTPPGPATEAAPALN